MAKFRPAYDLRKYRCPCCNAVFEATLYRIRLVVGGWGHRCPMCHWGIVSRRDLVDGQENTAGDGSA